MAAAAPRLLKISALAVGSGVPVPTIKHYLRERLLPPPSITKRNVAYYDASLVERVKVIKRLQATRKLQLSAIRDVMARLDDRVLSNELELEAAIARVLRELAPEDSLRKSELLAAGFGERHLAAFVSLGIVEPIADGDDERFVADDAALLRLLLEARGVGLSASMLPATIIGSYVEALQELVRVELEIFRSGVLPHAGADLPRLTEVATFMSERLVVLLRRKLLLPTLRDLAAGTGTRSKSTKRKTRRT
jgi:DNA-binding transcriptional MerR regulator